MTTWRRISATYRPGGYRHTPPALRDVDPSYSRHRISAGAKRDRRTSAGPDCSCYLSCLIPIFWRLYLRRVASGTYELITAATPAINMAASSRPMTIFNTVQVPPFPARAKRHERILHQRGPNRTSAGSNHTRSRQGNQLAPSSDREARRCQQPTARDEAESNLSRFPCS